MRRPLNILIIACAALTAAVAPAGATSSQGPYQYCPTGSDKAAPLAGGTAYCPMGATLSTSSQGPYQYCPTGGDKFTSSQGPYQYCPR